MSALSYKSESGFGQSQGGGPTEASLNTKRKRGGGGGKIESALWPKTDLAKRRGELVTERRVHSVEKVDWRGGGGVWVVLMTACYWF